MTVSAKLLEDASVASEKMQPPPSPTLQFMKGVGISTWQSSGDESSNWTRFARKRWPWARFGVPSCGGGYDISKTCKFWDRYEEDIKLAADLGTNSFRFSFEWARIEPQRGVIDESAIKHCHAILDCLERHHLEPSVTIHHFTHPVWFEDLGGFEKAENIPLVVDFARLLFARFGKRIRLWATINEPSCFAFLGYLTGMGPPGYLMRPVMAGRVLLNLLRTHVAVYRALKAMPGGPEAQVGLVHHMIAFEARGQGAIYAPAKWCAKWFTAFWARDVVDAWMRTGAFRWSVPLLGEVIYFKDGGAPPCDWLGINYYSRPVVSAFLQPTTMPGETMTDMKYPLYPEGLYDALKLSSAYGIPLYIAETGVADKGDSLRGAAIRSYFNQVLRAMADGIDVRGFYYWTLMDNFEWSQGFRMKFGIYAYEPNGARPRGELKESGKALIEVYKALPDSVPAVRAHALRLRKLAAVDDSLGVDDKTKANEGLVLEALAH